jgi:hypothetical protein
MEFLIDGQPVCRSLRKKVGPQMLAIGAGDGFSAGHVAFDRFRLARAPGSQADSSLPAVGVDVPGEVDGAKGGSSLAVAPSFDIAKSWRLSLEFWAPSFPKDDHTIFFWGDERDGLQALVLGLNGVVLAAQAANTTGGTKGPVLTSRLSGSDSRHWIAVRFDYDVGEHEFSLFVGNKQVAHERSSIVPWLDRPMPVTLGHARATKRFFGRVRNVRLENVP